MDRFEGDIAGGPIGRVTRAVLRHRRAVLAVWLVLFVVSGIAALGLSDLLTNRFVLPGAESEKAGEILDEHFGQRPEGSFTLVARGAPGSARRLVPQVRDAGERAAGALETGRLASVQAVSDSVVSASIVSNLQPADAKSFTDDMRDAAGEVAGARLYLTGQSAIEYDLQPVQDEDLKVGEFYIAIPIALLILVFVFGTLAFLVPFMLTAFAIPVTLGVVWIFANFMTLSTYLTNMVMLIGLGIAIDYTLLVLYRYREERRAGAEKEEAILRTMQTAGRAVVFSGTAVAIGLALMLAMPLPFMRGFGLAGLLIPVVSVAAALTILPVLLYWLADRLDRVRLVPRRVVDRREDEQRNFWVRLSRWIMQRPLVFAAGASALLIALAVPVTAIDVGPGSNKGIPQDLEAVRGLNVLSAAVGEGAISPSEIVVDTGRPGGVSSPEIEAAVNRLVAGLKADPEVAGVVARDAPDFSDKTGRYLHVQAWGRHEYGLPQAQEFVDRLRDEIVPAARFPHGAEVLAGGGPPFGVDFLDMTYGAFPWLVIAVLLLTYVLLVRAFRSLLLPLKAIVMNLLAIGAAYGLLVAVFKWGLGEPFGLTQFDQIEGWIPVFLFAMLFGLSMDYEVFLVSRMREEWDNTRDNVTAVSLGLARTGRIVTAAGLIMFAAFMGFVAGSIVGLQQFGFGLAAAILIDVTIIRALLVPSLMKVFGRWNWWLPERVARLVRVPASPLTPPALEPAGARS
jgi:RND superfamily putative drug exporter